MAEIGYNPLLSKTNQQSNPGSLVKMTKWSFSRRKCCSEIQGGVPFQTCFSPRKWKKPTASFFNHRGSRSTVQPPWREQITGSFYRLLLELIFSPCLSNLHYWEEQWINSLFGLFSFKFLWCFYHIFVITIKITIWYVGILITLMATHTPFLSVHMLNSMSCKAWIRDSSSPSKSEISRVLVRFKS